MTKYILASLFVFYGFIQQAGAQGRPASSFRVPSCVIAVDHLLQLKRTSLINDNGRLAYWVILKNGKVADKYGARSKPAFVYSKNDIGVFTVYIEQFVDRGYRPVSNVISYRIGEIVPTPTPTDVRINRGRYSCKLTVSKDGVINRGLLPREATANPVWVITRDGGKYLRRNANNQTQITCIGGKPGLYSLTLELNGKQVSNSITYRY